MKIVLFVCEGNIHRSQMAEAFFNSQAPDGWHALSAGTKPRRDHVHPGAVALMKELGIDMSGQAPRLFDPSVAAEAWRVVAICDPQGFPTEVLELTERWPIIDPADLPATRWPEIRDEIRRRVDVLVGEIQNL
jgi:arsenate reductase (thioredoxin)